MEGEEKRSCNCSVWLLKPESRTTVQDQVIADFFVTLLCWWHGVVCNAFWMKRSYSMPGPVSTVMGDWWVTACRQVNHLGAKAAS